MLLRAFFVALSRHKGMKKFCIKNRWVQKMAHRFVAGHTLEEALSAVKQLNQQGITVTLDHLGENVSNPEEAIKATDEAVRIYEFIQTNNLEGNVSIKLTQMGLDVDETLCRENVARILKKAQRHNSFLRIDMEDSHHTQTTLNIFYDFRKKSDHVGIVLQAYLYRTPQDLEDTLALKGRVRLCKGAYKEPATLAYPKKKDVNKAYLSLMQKLLDSPYYHAIATHDVALIHATKDYAKKIGKAQKDFEFQMLYGIRRDLQLGLVKEGYPVRVYVPYGWEWYPYFMRRLGERPANLFFLLRNLFRK